jgi:ATP-dependent Zn protease
LGTLAINLRVESATQLDRIIQNMLEEYHLVIRNLLVKHRAKLDALAQALIKYETIDRSGLIEILGPAMSVDLPNHLLHTPEAR